jgi:aryl-alcohol dehydrogenase-like predicted oxidoreductase
MPWARSKKGITHSGNTVDHRRPLGGAGIEVSPLCFGGNVFGWTVDEGTSFRLLDTFVAAGFNFVDTADVYSTWVPGHTGGESEAIIGRWLQRRGRRDDVVIATKVGMEMPYGQGLSKRHILRAAEESLKRLHTDYIDLYQSHTDDAPKRDVGIARRMARAARRSLGLADKAASLEETLGAYDQLVRQGKVRAIGASNYRGPRLAEALETAKRCGLPAYQCLQPRYNLYHRTEYERELEPVCRKYGLAVINYSALASGFLTGKYRSEADLGQSARGQDVAKRYLNARGRRILQAMDGVAKDFDASQAAIALAWLLTRPSITAPIVSATSLAQLEQIMAATRIQMDAQALNLLNEASAPSDELAP